MWALGLSLYEIVAGKHPFANMTSFQTMMTIRTWTPTIPSTPKISDDMKDLIANLYVFRLSTNDYYYYYCFLFKFRLKKNVEERPKTYLEVLDTPSVQNVSETPSIEEKAFVVHIIDTIPPSND